MSKYSKITPKSSAKLKQHLGSLYKYINQNDRVLDFGSSTGYFGKLLIDSKKCEVDGVEIDEADFAEASKVLNLMYSFDLDTEDWPSELFENRYDVLFFGDILEHLKYPERVLMKAKPLLKKNGRILISTPNIAHISTRLELLSGEFNYESTGLLDNTHLKYYTLRTLKQLAADAEYKIIDIDYSLVDFSPTVIKKLLHRVGLTPSDEFWKLVNSPEARAYQYKLVLQPAGRGAKATAPKLPVKPIAEHDVLGEHLSNLAQENETLKLESRRALMELDNILRSKTWRAANYVKRPYLYIRAKFKA